MEIVHSDAVIDMLLVDIAMPETSGVEVMEAVLKKRPALPFLHMTGYVGRTKLDQPEQHILKKPFTIAELAAKVERGVVFACARAARPGQWIRPAETIVVAAGTAL
jgi:CheY-like chemotaxis protein